MKIARLALLTLLLDLPAAPIWAQTLTATAKPGTPPNTWEFSATSLPAIKQDPDNPWHPFYWGFWIYGDGEYAPCPVRPYWASYPVPVQKSASTGAPGAPASVHSYPSGVAASYSAFCYLMERKGDDPIPYANPVSNIVSVAAGNAEFKRSSRLTNGRQIYIEHSQGYYQNKDEKGVFAISYDPRDFTQGGEVLLFYNSRKELSGNLKSFNLFTYANTHLPNYGTAAALTPVLSSTTPALGGKIFEKVYRWPFNYSYAQAAWTGPLKADPGELRIFPVFSTNDDQTGDPDTYPAYVLAVLVRKGPPPTYDTPTALRLNSLLAGVVPSPLTNPIKIDNSSWVVDADTIFLRRGEPTDPNWLKVHEICACSPQQYKVTFRLTYQNIGKSSAMKALVHLNALHPDFKFCEILGARYLQGSNDPAPAYVWDSSNNEVAIQMNRAGGLSTGEEVELLFTMAIEKNAFKDLYTLRQLLNERPVAGGDVSFEGSADPPLRFINQKISLDNPVEFPDSPACVDQDCCGAPPPPLLLYLLASAVLIVLGWFGLKWMRKK